MIQSAQYTLNSTPTKIYIGDGASKALIHCESGTVYLGDSDLTTSTGFKIKNDVTVLDSHESSIYAISATSATIYVLVMSK